jgi:3-phosphoshikimate 1-carboxyvinyltransferase
MQAIINPGTINGTITPPPSKSMMQRVCAAALLHKGKTIIHNPGVSNDDKAALQIIQQLGASIIYATNGPMTITSNGVRPITDTLNCGESGLSTRLFTPIAALSKKAITITGEGSLLTRPMHVFEQILPKLGVTITTNKGCVPIQIKGPLQTHDITIDGSLSSQFVSGLLYAFAFNTTKPITVKVTNLISKPYIDLSLYVLRKFGINLMHERHEKFYFEGYNEHDNDRTVYIEADWSIAAVWLVAGVIAGEITLSGLNMHSTQADIAILKVLKQVGAIVKIEGHSVQISKAENLTAFSFDAVHCPDLIPILSILAACCEGTSEIKGMNRLIHKESNRVESISAMLYHLGISFRVEGNSLFVDGADYFEPAEIDSYNDHRIVMAASVAALRADGAVVVKNAEAIAKSYPVFFKDLSSVDGNCILNNE